MKKIDLSKVEDFKGFPSVPAGGYVCGIYEVEDVPEKEYLKLSYDIIEGEYKGFYAKRTNKDGNKMPLPIFYASYKDTVLSRFKGTITAIEKSNANFKFNDDETKLKGKKIGFVFAEEEYGKDDGTVATSLKAVQAHSIEAIKKGDFKVPEKKLLPQNTSTSAFGGGSKPTPSNPFEKAKEDKSPFEEDDSDLPFGSEEVNSFDVDTDEFPFE